MPDRLGAPGALGNSAAIQFEERVVLHQELTNRKNATKAKTC
jgi:hypothetical protein